MSCLALIYFLLAFVVVSHLAKLEQLFVSLFKSDCLGIVAIIFMNVGFAYLRVYALLL